MSALVSPASFTGGGGGGGGAFDVPLDYYTVFGGVANGATVAVNTTPATVMPEGGTAPYTFSWAKTSGDASWSILSPTAATTQFRRTDVAPGDEETAEFECTVTDAASAVATSATCQATVTNYGDPGGFLP